VGNRMYQDTFSERSGGKTIILLYPGGVLFNWIILEDVYIFFH